jgi:glucokinase-like ROK family protein
MTAVTSPSGKRVPGRARGAATASRERRPGPIPDESLDALVRVLDEVRLGHAQSRSELVARTGLGRAVVTERVAQLLDRDLVREDETGPSTGGRPPRRLAFHAEAGHLLVADLGATSIDVAVTSLAGRLLAHRSEAADVNVGPDGTLGRVDELFRALLATSPDLPGRLWGVGIGVPGSVEFRTGRPISPIMPGWDGYPIRAAFAARYDAPVWVDNDVNVLALGEVRAGAAAGHENVVVVKLGTGIGAGIISEGRLHRGAQGSAGDVGHIQVTDDPAVVCRCGNRGCLEALAGGAAIGRDGEAAAAAGRSRVLAEALATNGAISAVDVARAASRGDPVAIEILQAAGRHVGTMLATVVNFFNPSLVVIGGGLAGSGDHLLASIRETVYRRSLPLATRDLLVQRSTLGELAGVIGASAMVEDQLFAREAVARWVEAGTPAGMPEVAERAA